MTDPSGAPFGDSPGAAPDARTLDAANDPSDPSTGGRTEPGTANAMESLDAGLAALEARLDRLTGLCERLALENRSLRGQQRALVEERARLVEKNETARTKVEQMIVRLKSLEAGQ